MKCNDVENLATLFHYGELSFDEEEALEGHLRECAECRALVERQNSVYRALADVTLEPPSEMLAASRRQLWERLSHLQENEGFWSRVRHGFTIHIRPIPTAWQPAGALALLALGFFGARLGNLPGISSQAAGFSEPVTAHVRYVEPRPSGEVRIVVEETREKVLSGRPGDASIERLLLTAARDPHDPGLRVESLDVLTGQGRTGQPRSAEVRDALLFALQHDTNPGVRLKALDGLRGWAGDDRTRQVLTEVLLHDDNPGVRTQAIDLLVQHKEDNIVGVLQELIRRDDNGYIRMRCERALHDMNASVETY